MNATVFVGKTKSYLEFVQEQNKAKNKKIIIIRIIEGIFSKQ